MKKVALLSDGWKRLITFAWVSGIMEKIRGTGKDVCLFHYNCYGNWSQDKKHNDGEYNIYNLPDLEKFDGIILDCTNISDKEQLEKLISMLRTLSVPVVSIVDLIEGFYYAGIDNMSTIMELMDHLYEVHGCRSFLFAGGPEESSENIMRMEAFKKSLEKYGLEVDSRLFLYGDYDYQSGVRYMTELYQQNQKLPDAIVCANDNIAAGICAEAEKVGLKVPDDFLVTGFDNLEKAAFFRPQITTASINRERIAAKAMEMLFDLWEGKQVEKLNFVPSQCIIGESCGCPNNGRVDYREYTRNHIISGVKRQADEEKLMRLESRMAACTGFEDIFKEISDYFADLQCDGFYIVVDKRLFRAAVDDDFPKVGYRLDEMVVAYASEHGKKMEIETVDELYAHIEENGSQNTYLFTPVHFREQTVGFTVLKNGRFLYDNPHFYDIHTTYVAALENLLKRKQIEQVNRKLKRMYNRDPMTGLYNRIAYTEIIKPEFENYCRQGVPCALIFLDVDYFKEINDLHGHEYGDRILKKIARILEDKCPEGGYVYRFGGDEFTVFFPNATQEYAEQFSADVEKEVQKLQVSISKGMIITDPDSRKTLDEYLIQADQKMYELKRRRHQ